jgi:hypothetical protein
VVGAEVDHTIALRNVMKYFMQEDIRNMIKIRNLKDKLNLCIISTKFAPVQNLYTN